MSRWTQVLVSLRNADPTGLTALSCLRGPMGLGDRIVGLQRRILWEISGPAEADAEMAIDRLRLAGELWNPNKETAWIRRHGEGIDRLHLDPQGGGSWVHALAWSPERDLDRRPHALRLLPGGGWSLRRGTLWSLESSDADPEARRRAARDAVICAGVGRGLLVHPHLEDLRWIDGELPLPWIGQGVAEGRSA